MSGVNSDYMTFAKWVCFGKLKPNNHIIWAVHCGVENNVLHAEALVGAEGSLASYCKFPTA